MLSSINVVVSKGGFARAAFRKRPILAVRRFVTSAETNTATAEPQTKTSNSPTFAVCFDIDGVLRRGPDVLPGAVEALQTLTRLGVPHIFITNGGGVHEHEKAAQLENQLNGRLLLGANPNNIDNNAKNGGSTSKNNDSEEEVRIHHSQMILAHTPMQQLVSEYADKRVLILGCRKEDEVARAYGFNKVVVPQQFARQHPGMYPFANLPAPDKDEFADEPIEAIMIFHDPSQWQLELQVCVDVLYGYDPLGKRYNGRDKDDVVSNNKSPQQHIPIFNANEDFVFSSDYPHPRFAQGAFLTCLETLYTELVGEGAKLEVQRFGKPHKVTFDFAHELLVKLQLNPPPLLTVSLNTDSYDEDEWERAWEKVEERKTSGQPSFNDDPSLEEKKEKKKRKKEYKKKKKEEENMKRKKAEEEQEEWEAEWEKEEARIMSRQNNSSLNNVEPVSEENISNSSDINTYEESKDEEEKEEHAIRTFDKIYMIGDNPRADIRGANLAGHPWHSILVRSGVFNGSIGSNDAVDPGRTPVDNVGEALEFILKEQGIERSDV